MIKRPQYGNRRARGRGNRVRRENLVALKTGGESELPGNHKRRKKTAKILNTMKYIAYCRKSTDEPDRQIMSIEAQIAELKEFAAKENLEIIDFVLESKTAKEPGRKKFNELLQRIENGEAQGIISWNPDRLARNSIDGGKIIYLLDTGELQSLKFPTHWFENTPQGKFMLSIAFGQAKYYIDNLSENVKRGIRQKLRNGIWPNMAPFGYKNDQITKKVRFDPKRAKYIKACFEMFATGGYTQVDIVDFLAKNNVKNPNGSKIYASKVQRMLTNPFYYGAMFFCGELYEGKHKPLISKKLFDQVQEILARRSRKYKSNKHEFDFLGLIKCGECGGTITAEKHMKHYKRTGRDATYIYYRCSKKRGRCSQRYIPASDLEIKIRLIVKNVSISNYVTKKFLEWAKGDVQKEKAGSSRTLEDLTRQLKETEEKLDRLLEGYLDKVIEVKEYQNKKSELVQNKLLLQAQAKEILEKGNDWLEPFSDFVKRSNCGTKIARAKNNLHELSIHARTVGSNFFLKDRQLTFAPSFQGYEILAAHPIAATPRPPISILR